MKSKVTNVVFVFDPESMILSVKIGDEFGISASQLVIETQFLILNLIGELSLIHGRRPLRIKGDGVLNPPVLAVIVGMMGKLLSAIAIYDYRISRYIVCTSTALHFLLGDILD